MEDQEELSQEVEMEGEAEESSQGQAKACKFPCIRCKKNVSKAGGGGVRCNTCYLWVHVKCQNISKELCAILSNPTKHGGCIYWFCDSCKASAQRLEAKMNAVEKTCQEVEIRMTRNEGITQEVSRRVETIEKRQDKVQELLEREREKMRKERVEEMRERELRKKNVLIHRIEEAGERARNVQERKEWDLCSCENIFNALKLKLTREDIKFCRRIGERKEEDRPLLVGFKREASKEDLLDMVHELKNTDFTEVGIVSDLTQEQRKDEAELSNEATRRNEARSEEEKSKNLIWRVVGRKGEKRLVRGQDREAEDVARMSSSGAAMLLPMRRGGGGWTPVSRGGMEQLRGRGGRGTWRGGAPAEGGREREDLLNLVRGGATGTRSRLASAKRPRALEEGEEEECQPDPPPPLAQDRLMIV